LRTDRENPVTTVIPGLTATADDGETEIPVVWRDRLRENDSSPGGY
jgi:hypothetical protein